MSGQAFEESAVSSRMRAKVVEMWGHEAADRVVARLEHLDLDDKDRRSERIQAAILIGAADHPQGLDGMCHLAETDWRDALIAGGLATQGSAEWVDTWLSGPGSGDGIVRAE